MKEIILTNDDISNQVQSIIRKIHLDNWMPDLIVGITRGGLIPATMISHYLNKPMKILNVSFRDGLETPIIDNELLKHITDELNILLVDDINDTGKTLSWIKEKYSMAVSNVRFAVLVENAGSQFKDVDYYAMDIDKNEEDLWVVFPYENWWNR